MERDFLGLSNRQPLRKVKREVHLDASSELGMWKKSSAMELPKLYSPASFMSPTQLHECENQESRVFPGRSNLCGLNQNAKPLLVGGVPMTSPSLLLPIFQGFTTDPRNNVASSAPQLTVFYAGTVNVFNDISPEKAQAIMLWAANGLSLSSVMENPKGETGDMRSKAVGDQSESPNAPSTPASSSSATHSAESVSISIDKPLASKPINVMGSFCAAATMIPSVPQARKASLARFLEKRKQRLMNAMPYSMSKMKLVECSTGESSGMNYSATSAA